MENTNFDLSYWAKKESVAASKSSQVNNQVAAATRAALPTTDLFSQVDAVVAEVEQRGIDLTQGYENWRNIGFALAEGLGNQGRGYFHTLSAQHPDYNEAECDKQYDACLNAHGSGITINSLFYAAKEAGIDISAIARQFGSSQSFTQIPQFEECGEMEAVVRQLRPTFSDKFLKKDLPEPLQKIYNLGGDADYLDMMLLGALVMVSGILPNYVGRYHRRHYWANFFVFVVASAASMKGDLPFLLKLVEPVEAALRKANAQALAEYEQKKAEHDAQKYKKGAKPVPEPKEPVERTLFVAANSSATAMYETLAENQETGSIMFDTEGDTLAQVCQNKEWGDWSVGWRKAFQHETIAYRRRSPKERVNVPKPRLAMLISGTADQVGNVIPTADNGTFSRIVFLELYQILKWDDVFIEGEQTPDEIYELIGKVFYERVYLPLSSRKTPLLFKFQPHQCKEFNAFFKELQEEQHSMLGDDIVATVRRLGLITFRLAMVLSAIRLVEMEGIDITTIETLECDDRDFRIAMEMSNVLISHATSVYTNLLNHPQKHYTTPAEGMNLAEKTILEKLNKRFTRPEYLRAAQECGVCEKTADRYLGKLQNRYKLAIRVQNGIFELLK